MRANITHYYITFYSRLSNISIMAPTKTTRTRTRSSATEPYSFEHCNEIINGQFRRQRNPSAPGGTEGRTTPGVGPSNSGRNASKIASGLAVDE